MSESLPGNTRHQQMLHFIISHYADDDRIRAVLLFGSLGRGNWDTYSDLDLDIVMRDDVPINARAELANLCDAIKAAHGLEAIIIADEEEGDVVLSSLLEFSIRYHTLATTKPAIIDTLLVLSGDLTIEQIRAAADANRTPYQPDLAEIVNQCIRYALEIYNYTLRGRPWMAIDLLARVRSLLMQLYTVSHGGIRSVHHFEAYADPHLHDQLTALLPSKDPERMKAIVADLITLLENDLPVYSNDQVQLTDSQRHILQAIKGGLSE